MKEYKAKTIEEAIEIGLKYMNLTREEADIKIINDKGLFKKATVQIQKKADIIVKNEIKNNQENCEEKQDKTLENLAQSSETNNNENCCENNNIASSESNVTCKKNIHENDKPVIEFLTNVLTNMGLSFSLDIKSNKDLLSITIKGDDSNYVIGYRGETLDNLQFLCLLVANKNTRFKKKLVLDAEGYRELRTETLTALSKKLAYKVAKTNTAIQLEPMNPFERRVIHTALQDDKYVTTSSEGEDPNRYVVISPIKKEKNMYDNSVSHNFKKSGIKTRSFGQKQKRF